MNKIGLLAFLLAISNCLFAQKQIGDLLAGLEQSKNDTQRAEAYTGIIEHYAAENPDSEDWYINKGLQYFAKNNNKDGAAMILAQAGISDENHGRVEIGRQRTSEALKIYREQHYLVGIAKMMHNLGAVEASKGNFDIAIKYFISALKVYDSITDYHGQMLAYMNLGNLYVAHGDTANAWQYLNTADSISKKTPVSDATIFLYNIIGVMHANKGDKDTALMIFLNNLKLSDKPDFVNSHIECLLYLSDFYAEKGDSEMSLKYLDEGLNTSKKYNIAEMEANFLLDIARLKEKTDPVAAINALNDAKTICEKIQSKAFLASVYAEMAIVYKVQGNFKDALAATDAKQKIADSLFSMDKTKEIARIDKGYELEKNNKIKELETLIRENTHKRNAIIAVTSIIIAILIVLLFYYRKTVMLNRELVKHDKELVELNTMKDKLFSIIGHDLRSPLTQIPAILGIYDDPATTDAEKKFMFDTLREHSNASLETLDKLLLWGESIVKGIGSSPVILNTKKLVTENIELKKTAANEKNITVTDNTPEDIIACSDARHFDFIIRNLLANAIKFTHENGIIEINAQKNKIPGFIIFEVKDNGIGIDKTLLSNIFKPLTSREGTAHEKGTGIGLMLCREFAIKNGGEIWVESEEGKGSSFFYAVKNGA